MTTIELNFKSFPFENVETFEDFLEVYVDLPIAYFNELEIEKDNSEYALIRNYIYAFLSDIVTRTEIVEYFMGKLLLDELLELNDTSSKHLLLNNHLEIIEACEYNLFENMNTNLKHWDISSDELVDETGIKSFFDCLRGIIYNLRGKFSTDTQQEVDLSSESVGGMNLSDRIVMLKEFGLLNELGDRGCDYKKQAQVVAAIIGKTSNKDEGQIYRYIKDFHTGKSNDPVKSVSSRERFKSYMTRFGISIKSLREII